MEAHMPAPFTFERVAELEARLRRITSGVRNFCDEQTYKDLRDIEFLMAETRHLAGMLSDAKEDERPAYGERFTQLFRG